MGPWPSKLKDSTGVVSPIVPTDSGLPAAMTNPAVSRPFMQEALTPSFFDQTTSNQIGQLSAPICEATQIKQNLSSLPAHDTSADVPQIDQTKQGHAMRGGSSQTSNSGTGERVKKRFQVEEYFQKTRFERQSEAIKLKGQPHRNGIEEQPQKAEVEDRPLKKIKTEHSD